MSAVTVTRRRTNVAGSRKHKEFTVNIAASGDTLDTRLRRIEQVIVSNPNEEIIEGEATLVGGTIQVAETRIAATDRIMLSRKTTGGTAGHLAISALVAGATFDITSSSGTDTSVIAYTIFKPNVVKTTVTGGSIAFTVDPNVALTGVKVLAIGN
jgi:hypothetical protein